MELKRFLLVASSTVLLTGLQTFWLNFPVTFGGSAVMAQTQNAREAEADKLYQKANELLKSNQSPAAIPFFQQALTILREIKNRKKEAVVLGLLGIAHRDVGDLTRAIEYHQLSLEIWQAIKDREGEKISLLELGTDYYDKKEYAKAIEYLKQALALARELKDSKIEPLVQNLIQLAEIRINPLKEVADGLFEQGNKQLDVNQFQSALKSWQLALKIYREIKDRDGEANTLVQLGIFYQSLGDYVQAIDYQQQRLDMALRINDRQGIQEALLNLGTVYHSLGDNIKAIDYFLHSLALAIEIKDRKGELLALNNLANISSEQEKFDEAINLYQKSLMIAQELKDRELEGAVLGNLGTVYRGLGDNIKARDYYQRSLIIARSTKDREGEGLLLAALGNVYSSLKDYTKAIEHYRQSLAISQEIGNLEYQGKALNNLGYILLLSGNVAEAETILRTGINTWESMRHKLGNKDDYKVSIFEQQARTYRTLQQVLVAQNKNKDAIEIAERGRARAFIDLLRQRLLTEESVLNNASITSANTSATTSIVQLQQTAKKQLANIVEYSIIKEDFLINGKLKYLESELYIWVITPTGEVTFRKADLKPLWQKQNTTLKDLVTITRDSIGVDDRSIIDVKVVNPVNEEERTKKLQLLYQLLIAPIADLLPTDPNQRLIFVPQEELFLVPFPALQDTQGKYLIEKHTILTAPSIQVLDLTRASREKVKQTAVEDAIVVGNPTMPSVPPKYGEKPQQLAPLKGAEREAKDIALLLNTKALTGNEATKAAVLARLPQARIVHLATHGLFDDFQGLQSAIALAPTNSDNGLLTASEILDLKLNADLVVLSACNTGRGRITGDGVIGLSRSLFIAGTPSVIVSLWSVPDAPTAELMSEFYTNLYQKKLDKAQALRQAMLKMMEKHRDNPRAWAAFTLIGEAQ
jgi:CHAT domain-containing protein/uncharacterized protein HemY